ncbi:MAG: hypothetical protein U0163_11720 [Gemmatimonadaceae bacterium]
MSVGILIGVVAVGAVLLGLRSVRPKSPVGIDAGNASAGLREGVLSRTMLSGVTAESPDAPIGAVMDWNVGSGLATLVAIVDGTVSLYVTPGGGTIGAGTRAEVAAAATTFRMVTSRAATHFRATSEYPAPSPDTVVFYLLFRDKTLSTGPLPVADLTSPTHPLAVVGGAAQALLTQVRRASQQAA